MAEDNYNLINPVEALHNVSQLNPTSQRQHRKRREWDKKQESEEEQTENQTDEEQNLQNGNIQNSNNHRIDFKA